MVLTICSCYLPNSEIEEDTVSLRQFSTELIIQATVKCLKIIDDSTNLPQSLPPGMSARFRLGTDLANACSVCIERNKVITLSCVHLIGFYCNQYTAMSNVNLISE